MAGESMNNKVFGDIIPDSEVIDTMILFAERRKAFCMNRNASLKLNAVGGSIASTKLDYMSDQVDISSLPYVEYK